MNEEQFLDAEARRRGISITQLKMQMAVGDDLVADLRADARRSNPVTSASSPIPPRPEDRPPARGTGWQDPQPHGLPPGVSACDRLMDMQDVLDRRDLERRLRPPPNDPPHQGPPEEVEDAPEPVEDLMDEPPEPDEILPGELDIDLPPPDAA